MSPQSLFDNHEVAQKVLIQVRTYLKLFVGQVGCCFYEFFFESNLSPRNKHQRCDITKIA